jgi:RNA polymerase sigma-70 factor (ECF subfamily)
VPRSAPKSRQAAAVLESTAALLVRVRHGDEAARDDLASRYYQVLRRFAHGRLPRSSRGMTETDDLVQITVMRALKHLDRFEPQREGAFLAYLRRILINEVRDEMRRASRAPELEPASESLDGHQPSPIEELVGKERLERFEAALSELRDREREAVILRVELGLAHQEIADALGIRTAHAARMYVSRAIAKLAERMRELGVTHEVP